MADKKSFKDRVSGYSDQYEAAIKKNARDFQKVAGECIDRGIKKVDDVLKDAYKGGIKIGKDFVEKYNVTVEQVKKAKVKLETGAVEALKGAKKFVKDKAEDAIELAGDAKDAVAKKAEEVGEATLEGAAKVAGATVKVGKLGKKAVIKGAKTVGKAGQKVYSATKGTAEKGSKAVANWFKARGKDVKQLGKTVKGKVTDAKDFVVGKAGDAKDFVVDKAEKAEDFVVEGAAKVAGATVAVGKLGTKAVIKGAKTVGKAGQKVYSATKGTAEKGAKAVASWFKARGKDVKQLGKTVQGKVTDAKDFVVGKAEDAKDFVVDKAEKAGDFVVEGAAKVAGATIATAKAGRDAVVGAKDKVVDGAKDFASTVETRRNVTVQNLARGARQTFTSFCDRLEQGAVSREERNQQAKEQREATKAKAEQSKEDQQMEQD